MKEDEEFTSWFTFMSGGANGVVFVVISGYNFIF